MIPKNLPFGTEIDDEGIWRQILTRPSAPERRPALFLDRDGVIVEEVHYLHKVADMRLETGAAETIKLANTLSVPVIIVTNQAGIGRGIFNWQAFIDVQEAMLDALAAEGAFVNAVFACPHHSDGKPPYNVADHAARKPNPGMLLAAHEQLPITFEGSWIVGDRAGDIAAAKRAGCTGGVHVGCGHGSAPGERKAALEYRGAGFTVLEAENIGNTHDKIPLLQSGGSK